MKVAAMVQWPLPCTIKQLQEFLGLRGTVGGSFEIVGSLADPLAPASGRIHFNGLQQPLEPLRNWRGRYRQRLSLLSPTFHGPLRLRQTRQTWASGQYSFSKVTPLFT